jgi:hypothetical protein
LPLELSKDPTHLSPRAKATEVDVARAQLHGAIVSFYDLFHDEQPESASLDSGFVGALLLESRAIRDVAATSPGLRRWFPSRGALLVRWPPPHAAAVVVAEAEGGCEHAVGCKCLLAGSLGLLAVGWMD